MEKTTAQRLVDAALALLATQGSAAVTVRAVEGAAGVPHGSVRHHFRDLAGLRAAVVEALLAAERVGPPDGTGAPPSVNELVDWWTGEGAPVATARYELMLVAAREEDLRDTFLRARDALVARVSALGVGRLDAEALVAMLDGLVLDALLRRRPPSLTLWQRALAAAVPVTPPPDPPQAVR